MIRGLCPAVYDDNDDDDDIDEDDDVCPRNIIIIPVYFNFYNDDAYLRVKVRLNEFIVVLMHKLDIKIILYLLHKYLLIS